MKDEIQLANLMIESIEKAISKEPIEEEKKEPSGVCCICGGDIIGYGNNAAPVANGRCCDKCNLDKVLPARIDLLNSSKQPKTESFKRRIK